MRICLECGKEINTPFDHDKNCAYIRLEKLINKLYIEQEKKKSNLTQI